MAIHCINLLLQNPMVNNVQIVWNVSNANLVREKSWVPMWKLKNEYLWKGVFLVNELVSALWKLTEEVMKQIEAI